MLQLLSQTIAPIVIVFGIFVWQKLGNKKPKLISIDKSFWLFLLVGLSASLPMIISPKQRAFYLMPSLPFYAMAAASMLSPSIKQLETSVKRKTQRLLLSCGVLLLLLAAIFSGFNYGTYDRDKEQIESIKLFSKEIPRQGHTQAAPHLCRDWRFIAYMARYGPVNVHCEEVDSGFLITQLDSWEEQGTVISQNQDYLLVKSN